MPTPWFEDDSFWADFAPLMFNDQRWSLAEEEAEAVIKLTDLKLPGRILDTCCGVGRHSLAFAARGFHVTGVDRTRIYLDAALESSRVEGYDIEFLLEDVRRFVRPGSFDAAVNMFTSFGYFENESEEKAFLSNVYTSLKPEGVFILDLMGKELLARDFRESEWFEQGDYLVLQKHRVLGHWERLENRWIVMEKEGKTIDYTFSHSVYSAVEISALLAEAGFSQVLIFGSLDGRPYNEHAERLIAVGKK